MSIHLRKNIFCPEIDTFRKEYIVKALFGIEAEAPKRHKQRHQTQTDIKGSFNTKSNDSSFLPILNTPKSCVKSPSLSAINTERLSLCNSGANTVRNLTTRDTMHKSNSAIRLDSAKQLENLESNPKIQLSTPKNKINSIETQEKGISLPGPQILITQETEKHIESESINPDLKSNDRAENSKKMRNSKDISTIRQFIKKYQPLDPTFFEELKSLPHLSIVYNKNGFYYGQVNESKARHGKGMIFYNNGRIYEGEWLNGQKTGKGVEKLPEGHIYKGDFQNGKPHGRGIFTWKDGDVYEGEFEKGVKHGKGSWRNLAGASYIGDWVQGRAEGIGVHVSENGDRYKGEFKNSLKHGRGTEEFANGDVHIGNYELGKPSGYGEYFWAHGSTFKGTFKEGLRDGKGLYMNPQGERYEGGYSEGKRSGYGEFVWASGNIYKGNFANDLREGFGEMIWTDGSYYKGEWNEGVQNGIGELYISGKCHSKGIFENNVLVEQHALTKNNSLPNNNSNKYMRLRKKVLSENVISKFTLSETRIIPIAADK